MLTACAGCAATEIGGETTTKAFGLARRATFVDNGDRVSTGQTVCIIEAMKLMNEIEAEVSGTVMEVLVENGTPVEYGQPLMRINPS